MTTVDNNYWKEAYKHLWEQTSKKELFVKKLLENETGYKVVEMGLGAGSTEYLSGSAVEHGQLKGDADLYVEDADVYVEVTGPNIPVDINAPLWIRPDKVRNSLAKRKDGYGRAHVVVHVADIKPDHHIELRVIVLGKAFIEGYNKGDITLIHPIIRGRQETYLSIPPGHTCVITFADLISLLKQLE